MSIMLGPRGSPVRGAARSRHGRLAAVVTLASMLVVGVPAAASAAPGSEQWVHRYDGPADGPDQAADLEVSPDGSQIFVTGSSRGATSRKDYATLAYDSEGGGKLWITRYNGRPNRTDLATDLAVSPDGSRVFVTGASARSPRDDDYATVAYDASTGDQLWVKRYDGPAGSHDYARAIGVSPDGTRVFVTGLSYGATGSGYVTIAYEASSGTQLWVKRYSGHGDFYSSASAIGVSPDGTEVFVTGVLAGTEGTSEYATVAYDASTGDRLWLERYDGGGRDVNFARALGVSPDGSHVYVTGFSGGRTSGRDYATVAYDPANGAELWVARYEGPPTRDDFADSLQVSPDGNQVFVTGRSARSPNEDDVATVAYDALTGDRLWASRFNGPANEFDFPADLGVSPDGAQVFMTGTTYGSTGYDYLTAAYDATNGTEVWVRLYHGPPDYDDIASALGVSPDGSAVFVTGSSFGRTSNLDYATLAYDVE